MQGQAVWGRRLGCAFVPSTRDNGRLLYITLNSLGSTLINGTRQLSTAAPSTELLEDDKDILDKVGLALGVSKLEDWYEISKKAILNSEGGEKLLTRYPSLEQLLRANYPYHNWDSSKFGVSRIKKGFFTDSARQRELLERIGKELGVKQLSDWYSITPTDVVKRGGWRLFRQHHSLQNTLAALYPGVQWDAEKFVENGGRVKKSFWKSRKNLLDTLDTAERLLHINQPEDWYTVTLADLKEVGFTAQVRKAELAELLEEKYPNHKWEKLYLLKGRYAQQKVLEKVIRTLFPDTDIKINARKEAGVLNPETNDFLELDVFLPNLNLAFEYQEKHHYTSSEFSYVPLDQIQQRDQQKSQLAASKGITLITIPCWWDGRTDSLVATIKIARPDLLTDVLATRAAIPEVPPPGFFDKKTPHVEDIGEPVTACFFTLSNVNPTGWWMFEKYDGVRGFWNPLKKQVYSRQGNVLHLPQEVIDAMPSDLFLDGELWFGRDQFRESLRMTNSGDVANIDWTRFKFMVFDIPNHVGPYKERYNILVERLGGTEHKYLEVAQREICKDLSHFETFFQDIVDKGGEGVILRDPISFLQAGRSTGFLKHKKFRDAEARIIGSVGTHTWECELPNGVRFAAPAGTTEFVKRYKPQKGDIVSFKHHGYLLQSKRPKLPTLYRLRTDITWEDVVNNWKEGKTVPTMGKIRLGRKRPKKINGYWKNAERCREYFCEYATKHGFDPLKPENWKTIKKAQLVAEQGFGPIGAYKSIEKALIRAFPELRSDIQAVKWKKAQFKRGYWRNTENCRTYFCNLAAEMGFDPLQPDNWRRLTIPQLKANKGASVLAKYGTIKKALRDCFPELDFASLEAKPKKRQQE